VTDYSTISKVHDAYRGGAKPSEVIAESLKVNEADDTNAVLLTLKERAEGQAQALDQEWARKGESVLSEKPLFGVPLGVKDLLTIDGVRTTCASKLLENYLPPYTATSVKRLEAAGAVSVNKLNMDEFAMGSSNENSAYGYVEHPTHPGYVPGGSSGGSATSVRRSLSTVALGTDTGGSIRQPASFTGIIGFKPTYGRVSRFGLVAFASSLDQIGPMTRNVDDAWKVYQAMAGHDPLDSTSAREELERTELAAKSLKGLRVGVPTEYFAQGLDASVEQKVRASLDAMKAQGAELVEVSLPHSKYAVATYYVVAVSEASSNLARYDGVRFGVRPKEVENAKSLAEFYEIVRSQFGPEVKRRIILGTFALSSGYYDAYYSKACKVRRLIKNDFDKAFERVDVIAGAVSPTPAFKRGAKIADPLQMYLNDILTIPVNLAGLPAVSLPLDTGSDLPIGLHLIGKRFDEATLLGVSKSLESEGVLA
jgi:aspartyl-tRNA(Asn)/glutamyl-tRNA(Gln) amidotransferase subunit A